MSSITVAFLHTDSREVVEHIVGVGSSGLVIQRGQFALKIPLLRREVQRVEGKRIIGRLTPEPGDYDDRQIMIQYIEEEKAIYRRLGECPGIVQCYDLDSPDHSIQMKLMKNGDLRHYLVTTRPDRQTQLSWLLGLARTLVHIHHRRVIVCDIRTDNILLDNDFSVKMTDFSESVMMPLDWNMDGVVELGYSVPTDIGAFGAVVFEIVTGAHCTFNLHQDWKEAGDSYKWPPRDSLPATNGVGFGHIIDRCWTEGSFISAEELVVELEQEQVRKDEAV
jgi:serine/threonine protein kinase